MSSLWPMVVLWEFSIFLVILSTHSPISQLNCLLLLTFSSTVNLLLAPFSIFDPICSCDHVQDNLLCSFALIGLKGWDPNCIYRQHGGTMSKMPAPLRFLKNFQVLLAERIPRIFLQLQVKNSGRETIQTIPFRI